MTTTQMLCPHCRKNTVPTVSWEFHQTSVHVEVCDVCHRSGLWSVQVKVSALAALYVPESVVRHRDGLVGFDS